MAHMLKPIIIAFKGKGLNSFLKRVWTLGRRYGLTVAKMDHALVQLSTVLQQFDARATLPITATALADKGDIIQKYQAQGIEFAVHGYRHVDYSQLSLAEQKIHFEKASKIFLEQGIHFAGFRSPYLRCNDHALAALAQSSFSYDSTPSLFWDIGQKHITDSYLRVLDFYGAQSAKDYPALPYLDEVNSLVRIPYCLPDDESLVERLKWNFPDEMNQIWSAMFHQIHQEGGLFTLGLHPERIFNCLAALTTTLHQVQAVEAEVWRATLGEIAAWWKARYAAAIDITQYSDNLHLDVNGIEGITVLIRSLETKTPTEFWFGDYRQVTELPCVIQIQKRPFIGVSPDTDPALVSFLKQQGYIIEESVKTDLYQFYIDQNSFTPENKKPLITQIESVSFPLVRLGRWPDGAQSAMCVTGDIDAITLWDYILRFLGK